MKQRLTIQDIAAKAGVSIKTVSRVFNNSPNVRAEKRDLVFSVASEMGYRPNISARQLASNRSFVIVHLSDNPNTDYLSRIYESMRSVCMERGYYAVAQQLRVKNNSYREALVDYLTRFEVDGILLSPPISDDPAVIDEILKRGIACALISPGTQQNDLINVFIDEEAAGRNITEYMIARGHGNLAFVSGLDTHAASVRREAGFWAALDTNHLPRESGVKIAGDFSMQSGFEAFAELQKTKPETTAIFAANDEMAIGIIIAALQAGKKIPEDLAVAGFDDSQFSRAMWPSVTSLAQPISDMIHTATQQLIGWSESGERGESQHLFPTEIRIRKSCP